MRYTAAIQGHHRGLARCSIVADHLAFPAPRGVGHVQQFPGPDISAAVDNVQADVGGHAEETGLVEVWVGGQDQRCPLVTGASRVDQVVACLVEEMQLTCGICLEG